MDDVFKMMLTQEVAKTFARVIEKDLMTDKEANLCSKYKLQELASLSFNERWRLYRFWVRKYKEFLNESLTKLEEELNEVLKTYAKEKKETDALVLKTATVIAMTTSGAARYHDVLKEIGPRIVIVEEAAEVLETHIVTALSPQCQHLILIGDHKQLEPKPSVYILEQHYNLGVSMFERMLNNGIENHCLQRQHRMRPDISTLVRDIYPVLEDNENVFEYSHVQGIEKDVFFINHSSPEDFGGDTRSYSNKHEATFVVALCRHLMKQGYATNQITILTAYSGQMFSVRNLMPRNEFEGVRAVAIDNFQGEETDIIILSLVRSNKTGNIGFLKRENRVCVALSRAKMGLYVVGNFSMFEKESPLWANILNKTKSTDQFGNALPICCQNHPDTRNLIADAKDFLKSPDGGCNRKCDFRLPCGHACRFYCHPWDKKHTEYKCKEKCKKTCLNGHQCRKTCHFDKECNCSVKMLKGLKCGHEASMQCYQSPDDYKCRVIVTRMLTCGHEAAMECHKPQEKHTCKVIVDRTLSCGHILPLECHIDPDSIRCDVVVNRTLERCGHDASMKCFVNPGTFKCLITVTRVLESCGHEATMKCNVDVTTYKCTSVVTRKLQACKHTAELECWVNSSQHKCNVMLRKQREKCGHSFDVECSQYSPVYEEETLCKTIVSKRYPRCQHVVDIPCHIKIDCFKCKTIVTKQWDCSHTAELECWDTDNAKCNQKCFKKCSLGHVCHKPCHYPEMCKCKILVEKTLQSCGHVKKMECHMDASRAQCQTYVMKELPCGHATEIECSKDVSQAHCKEIVSKLLALCGHSQDMECSQDPCSFKCAALIDKILPKCGHTMKVKCSADPKREICNTTVLKSLPCGHEMEMKCCTSPKKSVCRAIVQIPRKMCNHTANVECSKVTRIDLDKVKCRTHTQQQLVCGHERMVECWKSTQQTPCDRKCTTILSCGHPCGGKCAKCSANLFHETCRKSCTVSPNELLSKIPLQKETRYISEISVYVTRFRTYLYIQQKLHLGRSVELLVKWAVSFTNMLTQFLTKSCKDTHLTFEQTHSINRNMCKLAAVWLFIIGSQFKSRSKSADWIGKETQQPDSQEMEKIAAEQDVLSKVETLIRKTPTFSTSDLQKVRALLQRVVTNASEAVIAFDFPVLEGLGVHRKDWITCNRDHPTPSDLLSKFYTKSSTTHTILQHGMGLGGEKYKESGKETGSDKVRGKGRWRGQSRQQSTEGKTEDAPMSLFHQVLMQNQFSEDKNKAPIRGHGGKLGKTSVDENRGLVKGSDGSDTTDNKCGRQDTVNNKEESHGTRQLGFNKVGRNSTKVCGGGIDRTDSKEHDGKNESGRGQGGRGRRRRGRGRGRGRDSSDNEEVVRNREKTGHGSDNASKGPRKISEGQDKSEKKANSRVVEEGLDRGRGKSRSAECGDESTVGDGGGNMGGRGGGSRGGRGGGSRGERDEGSSRRGGGSGSNSGRGGDSRGGHGGGSSSGRGGGFGNNSGRDGDSRDGRGGGSSRGRGGDSRGGRSGGSSSGRGGGGGSSSGRGGDSRGGRGGGSRSGRGGDSRGGRGGGSSSGRGGGSRGGRGGGSSSRRGGGSGSNGGRGEGSRGGRGGSSSGARGGGSGNNE
ncbi:uncharacterized protein [Argopecten irradians]|uniref:uncharacterized protein n=1 Tax=Argopecten irradians TaxID=31199 RepID=UPI003717DCB7